MIKFDMWYGNSYIEADEIDANFYPADGKYRGNLYKNGKVIGDYVCNDSVELQKIFDQLSLRKQECMYTKEQLLDVMNSYLTIIKKDSGEHPAVVLDDIAKSIQCVLGKNHYNR